MFFIEQTKININLHELQIQKTFIGFLQYYLNITIILQTVCRFNWHTECMRFELKNCKITFSFVYFLF